MQAMISKMAAGLDIIFEALLQDDARGLPPLLFAQAFPSPPDFSGWDAADAALAELTEVQSPSSTMPACDACPDVRPSILQHQGSTR